MRLTWGPSLQARCLVLVAVAALVTAIAARRVEALAVGIPSLWAVLTATRSAEATAVHVTAPRDRRGIEGEPIELALAVHLDQPAHVQATLALPTPLAGDVDFAGWGQAFEVTGAPVVRRWGRHRPGPLRLELLDRSGMRSALVDVPLSFAVLALPRQVPLADAPAPSVLPNRLGEHVTRSVGSGVEPVGVRAYAPGDSLRRVNWRVSSRRQQLHVTLTAAERSLELVLVLDALTDVGEPPDTTLDRAVRTTAGLAARYLREHDRVGLVILGGALRWLTPATGRVQTQRIAEAVLMAWAPPGEVPPDVMRVPRVVLPDGAVVVLVSPLVEDRALLAVEALQRRASRVLVVDVLRDEGPDVERRDDVGAVALRLWRLERQAAIARLRRNGVPVLQAHNAELERLLALAMRRNR